MVPTGLDNEKLLLQISRLEESLKTLKECPLDSDLSHSAAERLIQISIEEILNIGNNLISGLGLRRAENYRDIFQVLEENKIITSKMSKELQTFAVFRNRIVHLYWKISEEEFKQQLKKVKVLTKFVETILKYKKKYKKRKNFNKSDLLTSQPHTL